VNRHLRVLDFALFLLVRERAKTTAIITVYALLVGLVGSLLLFVSALRQETRRALATAPEIVVQRLRGGRLDLMPLERAAEVARLRGVTSVVPRTWGYSFDPPTRATFTLWGVESVPLEPLRFVEGRWLDADEERACVVGQGVLDARFLGLGDRLPIRGGGDELFAPRVVGVFRAESDLLTHDLVILPTREVRRILDMPEGTATDLAVRVANPREVTTVARKIQERWADVRVIPREQLITTYDAAFDWRAGIWGAGLLAALLAFAILVWDQATGLSAEESRTLGILKAVGWTSREVLELELYKGLVVSTASLLAGWILAHIHVFWLDGALFVPVLKGWSVLLPSFDLRPAETLEAWLPCLLLIAIPYLAARLIPCWRAATTDPGNLLEGAP